MKFTMMSNIGTYHVKLNGENEDVVCYDSDKGKNVITLADGVSTCNEAKKGAEITSHAITNLFLKKGSFFLESDQKQVTKWALSHVLHELKRQADKDSKAIEEYSSTLSSVFVDEKNGKMLCFNLGDNIIFATGNGRCCVLAMPENSSDGCSVTTTKNASIMVTTKIIETSKIDAVIICSDGAWKQMYQKNKMKPEIHDLLVNHKFDDLKRYFQSRNSMDDCSFISMNLEQKNGRRPA